MKQIIIRLVKYLLLPVGVVFACFRKQPSFIILMYHRVNDGVQKELAVRESDFRWQMEYLKKKDYQVISLEEALKLGEKENMKGRHVVLTFDDGYADFATVSYPVLKQYAYPSLVYVVPGCVETKGVFWWDRDLGESPLMTWQQMQEIAKDGLVEFGSHTMTHPDFDKITKEEALTELCQSKAAITEKLGNTPRHFAYPRGIVGHIGEVSSEYHTAAAIFDGYDSAHAEKNDYLMRLQRVPVQRSDGKWLFIARLRGWLVAEGWLKALLGRR